MVTTNKHREEINNEKLDKLLPTERLYTCHSTDRTLNASDDIKLPKNLPYTQTGSLPAELRIKVGAPIVITMNHKKKLFKEDGIINGATGHIEFIEVSESDPDEVTVIWIVFNKKENGAVYRAQPEHLKLRKNLPLSEYAPQYYPQRILSN